MTFLVQQYIDGQWVDLLKTILLNEAKSFASKNRKNKEIITIDGWLNGQVIQPDIPY
jgi:hypothetical protein